MSTTSEEKENNAPRKNKFMQQTLPAWKPLLSSGAAIPVFFAVGAIFIPIGVALILASESVQEVKVDYTESCIPRDSAYANCNDFLSEPSNNGSICQCTYNFTLNQDFTGQVFMYYGLTNYYQNHFKYVNGRDDFQLIGESISPSDLSENCIPYRREGEEEAGDDGGKGYAPCGTIANSLFNDSFTLTYINEGANENVGLSGTNIAWNSDKNIKFQNPDDWDENQYTKLPNWPEPVWELDPDNEENNGYENEDFIVWMRTAALPDFRKLHRRIVHDSGTSFADGLPQGEYSLAVDFAYPVESFGGRKQVILATTSWIGGKNLFMGIGYIVIGCIYFLVGVAFLIIRIKVSNYM